MIASSGTPISFDVLVPDIDNALLADTFPDRQPSRIHMGNSLTGCCLLPQGGAFFCKETCDFNTTACVGFRDEFAQQVRV